MAGSREIHLGPDEGKTLNVLGADFTIKARSADTGGAYFAAECVLDDVELPPHRHRNDEEAIFCIDGALKVTIGDKVHDAQAGSFFLVPRGMVHNIEQSSTEPARAMLLFSPGETEGMIDEAAGVTDQQRIGEIAEKFGMEVVEPE